MCNLFKYGSTNCTKQLKRRETNEKAYSAILATTLICGSVFTATGAQASTVNTQTVQTEKETETNFLQFTGTVSKIIKNDNGTF